MSWLWSGFENWWRQTLQDFAFALVELIAGRLTPHPYWEYPWAIGARNVITAAAWSVLVILTIYEAWRLYIARDAGEVTIPASVLIRRTITAGAAIPLTSWGLTYIVQLGQAATAEITALAGDPNLYEWGYKLVNNTFHGITAFETFGATLLSIFLILAILLIAFLMVLQAWVRGAELAIASIIGPVCALSAARSDDALSSGLLGMWLKEVMVLAFTQVLQIAVLVGVTSLVLDGEFDLAKTATSIPLLYVALKIPTILRNYVYTSGAGASGGGTSMVLGAVGSVFRLAKW